MSERVSSDNEWAPPHETVTDGVGDLLQGAYDLHVHAGPDRRHRRFDALDLARDYHAAGFAGAVIKDHFLPTIGRTHVINRLLPDFRCFSTLVLNSSVGGLNPAAVETALDAGVEWFIMPTVSALEYRRYEQLDDGNPAWQDLSVVNADGGLLPAVHDILDLLAGRDVVLASGHLSPPETLTLFREAHRKGAGRLIVTHASIDFLQMPREMQKEIASFGGLIEHVYVSCVFRQPVPLAEIWDQMCDVGLDSSYLASDLGQPHNPAPLVGWRAAVGGLLALGASPAEIERVIREVPEKLVSSLPRFPGAWFPEDWSPTFVLA